MKSCDLILLVCCDPLLDKVRYHNLHHCWSSPLGWWSRLAFLVQPGICCTGWTPSTPMTPLTLHHSGGKLFSVQLAGNICSALRNKNWGYNSLKMYHFNLKWCLCYSWMLQCFLTLFFSNKSTALVPELRFNVTSNDIKSVGYQVITISVKAFTLPQYLFS